MKLYRQPFNASIKSKAVQTKKDRPEGKEKMFNIKIH